MKWTDSMKEDIGLSLQEVSRAGEDGTWWTITGSAGVKADSMAQNTITTLANRKEKVVKSMQMKFSLFLLFLSFLLSFSH